MHQASDGGGVGVTYFVFDLQLDGEDLTGLPLIGRKRRLAVVLKTSPPGVMFNDHETGDGEAFPRAACQHGLEGIVSKRADRRICRTTAARGSRPNVSIAPSSSSSGAQIRMGHGRFSARFCSAISTMMATCSMPAGSERGCRKRRLPCSIAG